MTNSMKAKEIIGLSGHIAGSQKDNGRKDAPEKDGPTTSEVLLRCSGTTARLVSSMAHSGWQRALFLVLVLSGGSAEGEVSSSPLSGSENPSPPLHHRALPNQAAGRNHGMRWFSLFRVTAFVPVGNSIQERRH